MVPLSCRGLFGGPSYFRTGDRAYEGSTRAQIKNVVAFPMFKREAGEATEIAAGGRRESARDRVLAPAQASWSDCASTAEMARLRPV